MDDKKILVKTGYNVCAKNYADNRDLLKNEKYLQTLVTYLKPKSKILDIGCGSGVPISKYFFDQNFDVTGLDISEEMIKLAKNNLPQCTFLVQDMTDINLPNNSFDAIVAFYSIIHVPREEHKTLLQKLHSLLKKGGYILITMGSDEWEDTSEDFHGAKMFWSHYDSKKNIKLVKESGFDIIESEIDTSWGEKHLVIVAKKL